MRTTRLLIVTGLPGTGKSTLARRLAQRHRVPLLAKDSIKEPLIDVLGAPDAARSRELSDASFAVLFALARELLIAQASLVLEGNFRPGEHEPAFLELAAIGGREGRSCAIAQILCRVEESVRQQRLEARAADLRAHEVRGSFPQYRGRAAPV